MQSFYRRDKFYLILSLQYYLEAPGSITNNENFLLLYVFYSYYSYHDITLPSALKNYI